MNIAVSNCHNPLPKSAIEMCGFSGKVIQRFSRDHISSSNRNIQKRFSLYDRVCLILS